MAARTRSQSRMSGEAGVEGADAENLAPAGQVSICFTHSISFALLARFVRFLVLVWVAQWFSIALARDDAGWFLFGRIDVLVWFGDPFQSLTLYP